MCMYIYVHIYIYIYIHTYIYIANLHDALVVLGLEAHDVVVGVDGLEVVLRLCTH